MLENSHAISALKSTICTWNRTRNINIEWIDIGLVKRRRYSTSTYILHAYFIRFFHQQNSKIHFYFQSVNRSLSFFLFLLLFSSFFHFDNVQRKFFSRAWCVHESLKAIFLKLKTVDYCFCALRSRYLFHWKRTWKRSFIRYNV